MATKRPDGRVEPGQRISSAFSARAWNRAQDAADMVLGVGTGFSVPQGQGDDFGIVYGPAGTLFGEPIYLERDSIGLTAVPHVRTAISGSVVTVGAVSAGTAEAIASTKAFTKVFGRSAINAGILGVALDESPNGSGIKRYRICGPALVRIISYSSLINMSGSAFGSFVSIRQGSGSSTVSNTYLRIDPAGTIPVSICTSLGATGAGNAPATGWGVAIL